jgi:hypothetical protein
VRTARTRLLEIRRKAIARKEQERDCGLRGVRAEQLLHLEPNNFLPQDGVWTTGQVTIPGIQIQIPERDRKSV